MKSLKQLLQPLSKHEFFQTYFEKDPLYIPSEKKQSYPYLFGFNELDQILSTNKISYPFLKIFKDGEELSRLKFESKKGLYGSPIIDVPKSIEYFSTGHSLILNRIDRLNPKLDEFSRGLEFDLKMKVETNLYLTPPNNFGFNVHFDPHDVFILQLEGTKLWTLYESEIPLVTDQLRVSKQSEENFVEKSTHLLNQGDVLYIPRGTYHKAKSTEETSMHLTFGLYPLLGHQLISQLAVKAQEELFFRKSVPSIDAPEEEKQKYFRLFAKKMEQFLDPICIEKLTVSKRAQLLNGQDINFKGVLLNQIKVESLNENSMIKMRAGVNAELKEGKRILKICMPQQIINLPIFLKPLIVQLLSNKEIRVSDVNEITDLQQRLKILKQLITKGFLEIVSQ
jgi:ribosomal protein L16 Arg81 hydroxylase